MSNDKNHLVGWSTRVLPATWNSTSRMPNVALTLSLICIISYAKIAPLRETPCENTAFQTFPWTKFFFFKVSFLSALIFDVTNGEWGEVRYVKTCQVRSCEQQVALGGSAAGRHLGNFHCLANPPSAVCALFKITALDCVFLQCALFKISLHCVLSVFCDFSCFQPVSAPVKAILHWSKSNMFRLCFSSVPRFSLGDFYIYIYHMLACHQCALDVLAQS